MPIQTDKYIERFLKIRTKDGKIAPFKINGPQKKLYEAIKSQAEAGKPIRIIILKARQMGFSTFTGGVIFKNCATKFHRKANITAHDTSATTALLDMYKRFYDCLPVEMKPARRKSNANELVLNNSDNTGLDCQIRCYTAGADSIGRGETFQYLHISEYAFWGKDKKETLLGLLQTVPKTADSIVIIESTANGFDDFRERWYGAVRGESDYFPLFVAWHDMDEYRLPFDDTVALSEEERNLMCEYNLDAEQIQWRRETLRNECGGDISLFMQEYPSSPDEAFIASGDTFFDKAIVVARINELEKANIKPQIGWFEFEWADENHINNDSIRFVERENGAVRIYESAKERVPYVIGGDTAGEGSDKFTLQCLDNRDGAQVAVLEGRVDDDTYCEQAYCMGIWYNRALLAIESNFNTYHNRRLQRMGYPRLWMRRVEDKITRKIIEQYGFRTTSVTRPQMLSELASKLRDEPYTINDIHTLREMLVFIKNSRGRPEAAENEHDDLVIGLAISNHIRQDQAKCEKAINDEYKAKLIERKDIKRIKGY